MRVLYYILLLLMLFLGATKAWLDYQLEHFTNEMVKQAQKYADVSYQQVRLTLPAQVIADAVQVQTVDFPVVNIQHLQLHKVYRFIQAHMQGQPTPEHWHLSAKNAQLSLQFLKNLPETQPLWQMLGYQAYYLSPAEWLSLLGRQLTADMELQAQWQQASGQVEAQVHMQSATLGTLEVFIKAQGMQQNTDWQAVQIQALRLSWWPGRWLPHFSQYLAQKQDISAAELRQQLAQKLLNDGQTLGVLDPPAQQAVKNFVQDLQPLHIRLQPAKPFSLQALSLLPPAQWQTRLGLSWQ